MPLVRSYASSAVRRSVACAFCQWCLVGLFKLSWRELCHFLIVSGMAGVGESKLRGMNLLRKDCFNAVGDFVGATGPGFDAGVNYAGIEG